MQPQRRSQKSLIRIGSDAIESQATREWDPIIPRIAVKIIIKVHYVLIVTAQIPLALFSRCFSPTTCLV